MPKRKDYSTPEVSTIPVSSDFATLIRKVPFNAFRSMAGSCGLTPVEARELCEAFRQHLEDGK